MEPQRIQRKRVKGWRMPDNTVSVTRPGRWGNPFPVSGHRTATEAVTRFRDALENGALPFTVEDVRRELAGKNLACWCRLGDPCHADVLIQMANKNSEVNNAARKESVDIGEQEDKRPVAVRRDGASMEIHIKGAQGGAILGTSDEKLAGYFLQQTNCAFPRVIDSEAELDENEYVKAANNALSIFYEIKPKDPVEAMLVSQMIGVHNTSMDLLQKAQAPYASFERRQQAMNQAVKMARTYALQMEAFKKYRTGGQQTMKVEHVHINEGAQAVIGNVSKGGGGGNETKFG